LEIAKICFDELSHPHQEWFPRINPAYPLENPPPVIFNEMNSSQWFMNVICNLALAAVHTMLSGKLEQNNHYFICAAPSHPPIPDCLLYLSTGYQLDGSGNLPPMLKATLEFKTPNAMKRNVFDFFNGETQSKLSKGS
jgi:hypothetical protein